MKWILFAFFCIYLTYVSCDESVPSDSVVSLVLAKSNTNHPTLIRTKRHEGEIAVETRGRWRKKHHRNGGGGQQQVYPTNVGGVTGSQSSANSQSSAWGQGGVGSGSQSSSNAQSGSIGHGGGTGSGSQASSNSGSWANGNGGSLSQSQASSSANSHGGGLGGSSSGANAQSSATGQGGFFFPGSYNGKK